MKGFQLLVLSAVFLVFTSFAPLHVHAPVTQFKAQLCNDCGFGNKKENCVKCGKWVASNGVPAVLCNDCGFGSKKDNCVKCGKWVANNGVPAKLCNDCGFGNKKENCAKCGKWAPK